MYVELKKSTKHGKKWMVTIFDDKTSRTKTIHFGDSTMKDYTQHKDIVRMKSYIARHKAREYWGKSGIKTAGFWSRWLLWNRTSISAAKAFISKKFKVKISIKRR